jgi:hypothetical protein
MIKNIAPICLKIFLKNFKLLYVLAGNHFRFHQQRMTCNSVFSRERIDLSRWLERLLAVPKRLLKGRIKEFLPEINYHERFVQRLVDKV